jgi:hypothetical protein
VWWDVLGAGRMQVAGVKHCCDDIWLLHYYCRCTWLNQASPRVPPVPLRQESLRSSVPLPCATVELLLHPIVSIRSKRFLPVASCAVQCAVQCANCALVHCTVLWCTALCFGALHCALVHCMKAACEASLLRLMFGPSRGILVTPPPDCSRWKGVSARNKMLQE